MIERCPMDASDAERHAWHLQRQMEQRARDAELDRSLAATRVRADAGKARHLARIRDYMAQLAAFHAAWRVQIGD